MTDDFVSRRTIEVKNQIPDLPLAGINVAVDARYLREPGMGIHSYLKAGIELLLDEGADVTLLANFPGEGLVKSYPGARWEEFGSRRNFVWEQLDLSRFIRKRSFDFYWAPANNGTPWRSIGRTRKVCTTHDIIPLRLPRLYIYRRPRFALPYFVWTLAGIFRSDILITDSEASADDIFRLFHRKSVVIAPMLSLVANNVTSGQLPPALLNRKYLIYSGGMDPRKNVGNLLSGFALARQRLPDLHLVIMGHGSEVLLPYIAEIDMTDHITLTGFVTEDVKMAILRRAQALIYPSLYEGFGLPVLEAFAADVPVVTSRNSALSEVAAGAAIYVDPLVPSSIAEGIITILQDDIADRQRELGRQRMEFYDIPSTRLKLINVFSSQTETPISSPRRHGTIRSGRAGDGKSY
jgi:glycosyltransferase involved in cell wall biosynthesis